MMKARFCHQRIRKVLFSSRKSKQNQSLLNWVEKSKQTRRKCSNQLKKGEKSFWHEDFIDETGLISSEAFHALT
jgi:hypothetical protein